MWILDREQLISERHWETKSFLSKETSNYHNVYHREIFRYDLEICYITTWELQGTEPILVKHFLKNQVFEVQIGGPKSLFKPLEK